MNKQLLLLAGVVLIGLLSLGIIFFLVNRGVQKQQSAVPSRASELDTSKCQGNPNAPAKCFDCKKDTTGDEVNILDFQCFTKYYGQTVGTP